ncbi:HERC1, partial [Symbiodinium pilosum]
LSSMREDMTTLKDQGTAIVDKVERSASVQEDRISDIRRHSMMIMDILTGTQEAIQNSLECIQNFTRAELMRDPAAQLETSMREVLNRQMGKLKESLMGEDGPALNLKDLVSGLAGRLETSAERLELSQANAPAPGHVEEAIRQELEAVALALSQQQRESGQDLQAQLGEFLRGELGTLKEAQSATAVSLQEKVGEWTSAVSENVSR